MKRRSTSKTGIRRGPLSKDEKDKIASLEISKTVEEIAALLKRSPVQVKSYLDEYIANAPTVIAQRSEIEELRHELHSQIDWVRFSTEFTPEELIFFENDYINYRVMLKDITQAERKDLYRLITLDIFMHRHNVDRMKAQGDIDRLERLIRREYDLPESQQNLERIQALEIQLGAARSATNQKTKEYKDLLDKAQDISKSLKMSRDQRIKNLEDRGKFIGLLKELELNERRQNIGEIVGLMDLAVEKEKWRLGAPHKFGDGLIDQPYLTPESVNYGNR